MRKGVFFLFESVFSPRRTVKYYHDKVDPSDAHAFAHAVICLCEMAGQFETPPDYHHRSKIRPKSPDKKRPPT